MNTPRDFACRRVGTAAFFEWTSNTVGPTGAIVNGVRLGDAASRRLEVAAKALQLFAVGTGIAIGLFIKDEVRTTERAIGSFTFVPHRHMRLDALVVNHPAQELGRAVGRITDEFLGVHTEAILDSLDHGLG